MSGGERKKRITQEQAWEEAGSEFYQESYPGALEDLEVLKRDPNHLKTLLPSKQNRGAGKFIYFCFYKNSYVYCYL
jgi:hypothetical protein